MNKLAYLTLLALLLTPACDSGSASSPDGGSGTADSSTGPDIDAGDPGFSKARGVVSVSKFPTLPGASLTGYFNDGPDLGPRTETQRIGSCRLMSYAPSLCEPTCAGFDLCISGQCESFPTRVNQGTIEWSYPGGQQDIVADGIQYYSATSTPTGLGAHSILVDGETLVVDSLPDLVAVGDWGTALVERTGDVVLRWSNSVAGARVRIAMTDCAGSHGGIGVSEIECEASDTGEITLPGAMLDALDNGDWSHGECGQHFLTRYNSASSTGDAFRFETTNPYDFYYFPGL